MRSLWFSLLVLASVAQGDGNSSLLHLFDGKTVDGWSIVGPGAWTVEEGILRGQSKAEDRKHSLLLSQDLYGDFQLVVEFRMAYGNSGVAFRARPVSANTGMRGYQAEIDHGKRVGGIFEPGGRQWLSVPLDTRTKDAYKERDWNTMTIAASDGRLIVRVNGVTMSDIDDPMGPKSGHIGLQLHGGMANAIEVRAIRVKVLNLPEGIEQ